MEIARTENSTGKEFKLYRRRYAILATVILLNISNAAQWINYSPVASTVQEYYRVDSFAVNLFSLSFLIMSFPFSFISTFTNDKFGLKYGIHIGAGLNVVGSLIKALGTSGIVDDLDSQYAISLAGQTLCAMAQSFLLFIPTKVSQTWFPDQHRAVTTTILALSNPFGIVIAQGSTPFIVQDSSDVPTNNYVWFGLAAVAEIVTLLSVTRGKPKTPPSRSADHGAEGRLGYLAQLRNTFTCFPYMLLLVTLGCGIGAFSALATLTQQLLCPLGYSDVVGGGANVAMVLMGFVGSAVMGITADRTKRFLEITKLAFGGAAFFGIFMLEFYLVPNQTAAIVIFCGLFGFFGVGGYPIGLELSVEATYPVEETISTAFIFLSGQVHGILIIILVPLLATDQSPERFYLNKCGESPTDLPKDYTVGILIMMTYMVAVLCCMIVFLQTRYKRMEAEVDRRKSLPNHEYQGITNKVLIEE